MPTIRIPLNDPATNRAPQAPGIGPRPKLAAVSMNGNWLRVSPLELERAKADLDQAYDIAEAARNGEDALGLVLR